MTALPPSHTFICLVCALLVSHMTFLKSKFVEVVHGGGGDGMGFTISFPVKDRVPSFPAYKALPELVYVFSPVLCRTVLPLCPLSFILGTHVLLLCGAVLLQDCKPLHFLEFSWVDHPSPASLLKRGTAMSLL